LNKKLEIIMNNKTITNNKGFTLVELAIVLVIIGLLVGGVLQGQELIKQAQIRNTVQQLISFDAAVNTFKAKYRQLPGDISRASAFGFNTPKGSATPNVSATSDTENDGDGDGNLESIIAAVDATRYATYAGEIANFWVHLTNTNVIKGEYNNNASTAVATVIDAFPEASVGTGIVGITESGYLHWVSGVNSILNDFDALEGVAGSLLGNQLSPEEAYGIDSKIDDGQPDSGVVKAVSEFNVTTSVFTDDPAGASNCNLTGGEYNLASDTRLCTIKIRSSS
jgi:prepilin-type N-terminal cleavage/methylation domain-containing protein